MLGIAGYASSILKKKADAAMDKITSIVAEDWKEASSVEKILSPVFSLVKNKSEIRKEVDDLNGKNAFSFYSNLNKRALNTTNALTMLVNAPEAKQVLSQALLFAQAKEKMGQRRECRVIRSDFTHNLVNLIASDAFH